MSVAHRLPPGLSIRGSVYQMRIGLPDDIRHLWPRQANGKLPTDAYRASLRTGNMDDAITKAYKLIAEFRERFAAVRAGAAPTAFISEKHEGQTCFPRRPQLIPHDGELGTAQLHTGFVTDSTGRKSSAEPPTTPAASAAPHTPQKPAKAPITLRDVVPYWIRRNAPSKNAEVDTDVALRRFEAAVGMVPLDEITKATGAKFVAYLLDGERGTSRKTAGNRASAITALVNVAIKEDLMDRNPMDLKFDTNIGAKRRTPWTDNELATIFRCTLFSNQMSEFPQWVDVTPEDARAVLLLLAHTGARVGEIGQLRCHDFVAINGIRAIHITGEAGTVKTSESERYVPLADHLLADPWFASWLDRAMARTGLAMPSLHGRVHTPAETYTRWFRKLRKELRLPMGHLYGTHKFRHWLRSALAAKNVNENTADSITGHAAQGSSGRRVYTASATLPTMLEALNRLSYPRCGATL